MPSQRETQKKSLTLIAVAGINQRDRDVELPLSQYSFLQGVFPEFTGLQSRIWGKRTLEKYAGAIYGIYQFWSPYGYGVGLYQFAGTTDYGVWLTPTTEIQIALIPNPSLSVDGGGFTVNEFGYSYGSNFGYADPNVCGLTFSATGTQQTACILPPTPAGTPDDHNGGPAGQGRQCHWSQTQVGLSISAYASSPVYGDTGAQDVIIGQGPPIQVPLPAIPVPPYAPYGGDPADVPFAVMARGSYQVGSDYHQNWQAYGGKVIFDFTALEANPAFVNATILMQQEILTVGLTKTTYTDVVLTSGQEFDAADFLPLDDSIRSVPDGFQQVVRCFPVAGSPLKANYRQRVCS